MDIKVEPPNIKVELSKNDKLENIRSFGREEIEIIQRCEEEDLKNALILNRKKKYALLRLLNRMNVHKQNLQLQKTQCRTYIVNDLQSLRRSTTFRLGMPYFKDKEMYSAPHNSDYFQMQKNDELVHQSYCIPRVWSPVDKTKLALAVYKLITMAKENEVRNQIKNCDLDDLENLQTELSYLRNKLVIAQIATKWISAKILTQDEVQRYKTELNRKITYLQTQIVQTNYKSELTEKLNIIKQEYAEVELRNYIISTVASWTGSIDWLYISCQEVLRHSDQECKFMWDAYMNPKVNKRPWTSEDNEKLVAIVNKNNIENWEIISYQLGLNKSAYQCCIHFFSKLWDSYRRTTWSSDEEVYLKTLVKMFQIGSFIPWVKISKYFNERSKDQIYKHYMTCMQLENVKKGSFTLAEDILLTALIKHYSSFKKATYFFSNRTITQLRDHYQAMGYQVRDWTFEDDIVILKHVEKYGESNWRYVTLDRSSTSIRHRYSLLKKWIRDNPNENIINVPKRKRGSKAQNQYLEDKFLLDKIVKQLLQEINNGALPENIFNLKSIEDILSQTSVDRIEKKPKRRYTKNAEMTARPIILNFFKMYYNFTGRQKNITELDYTKGAEQVHTILNLLGAHLDIPDVNELKNNIHLDEFDIKILQELKGGPPEPQPGPSKQTTPTPKTRMEEINQKILAALSKSQKMDSSRPNDHQIVGESSEAPKIEPQFQSSLSNHSIDLPSPSDHSIDSNLVKFDELDPKIDKRFGTTYQNYIKVVKGATEVHKKDLKLQTCALETCGDHKLEAGPSSQSQKLTVLLADQTAVLEVTNTKTITKSTPRSSKDIVSYFPPNPETLIGFRGLMLYMPDLKNYAANHYYQINHFLPSGSKFDIYHTGIKNTTRISLEQISLLDAHSQINVVRERDVFKKRVRTLFKWPALMSLPENKPEQNIFDSDKSSESSNSESSLVEKKPNRGRPRKVSDRILNMVEAKKRKKNNSDKEKTDLKKPKIDESVQL